MTMTLFFSIVIATFAIFVAFKILRAITRLVIVFSLVVIAISAVAYFTPSLLAFIR